MGRNVIEKIQIKLDLFRFAIMIFGTMIVYTYAYKTHVFESFGAFIIYNSLYSYFITSFLGLTSAFVKVISLLPLIERVKPILSTKPEDIANGIGLKNIRGKIDLNNIYLRYENPNKYHFIDNSILNAYDSEQYISPWILKNINISIEENDFVAIVGLSGSGKTTLVKILLGLLTPHRGTISIDDYDMQVIDKQSYRKSIGTVLQSSTLFAGSIIENIVGNNTCEMNRIHELAVKIGVDEFINALPMKYETLLAEGGKNISMGQKQKILLMKALINHPKIIMLDEATSALDNQSQRKVFQYLEEIQSTRIIVSHRLSTVKQAHKILIIDKGTIVAAGSYQDIISSSHFKKLMQL